MDTKMANNNSIGKGAKAAAGKIGKGAKAVAGKIGKGAKAAAGKSNENFRKSNIDSSNYLYFLGSQMFLYEKDYSMFKEGSKLTKPVLYSTIVLILAAVIPVISVSASPDNIPVNGPNYYHDLLPTMIGFISAIILFIYGTLKGAGSPATS